MMSDEEEMRCSHLLASFKNLDDLQQPITASSRIKYTCVAVSKTYIALGSSSGAVHVFLRDSHRYASLIAGDKDGSVVKLAIGPEENAIGYATSKGLVYIYSLRKDQRSKPEKLRSTSDHKGALVTCLTWSGLGNKLIIGDDLGKATAANIALGAKDLFKLSTEVIMKLDKPIIQIDTWKDYMLVSTTERTFIGCASKHQYTHIGSKPRDGLYGACFLPPVTSGGEPMIYCSRPGSRMWEVSQGGSVLNTHQFKALLAVPSLPLVTPLTSEDYTLIPTECQPQSINFPVLQVIGQRYLVTLNDIGLFLFDPAEVKVVLWNSDLKRPVDWACYNRDIYILQEDSILNFELLPISKVIAKCVSTNKWNLAAKLCLIFGSSIKSASSRRNVSITMVMDMRDHMTKAGCLETAEKLTELIPTLEDILTPDNESSSSQSSRCSSANYEQTECGIFRIKNNRDSPVFYEGGGKDTPVAGAVENISDSDSISQTSSELEVFRDQKENAFANGDSISKASYDSSVGSTTEQHENDVTYENLSEIPSIHISTESEVFLDNSEETDVAAVFTPKASKVRGKGKKVRAARIVLDDDSEVKSVKKTKRTLSTGSNKKALESKSTPGRSVSMIDNSHSKDFNVDACTAGQIVESEGVRTDACLGSDKIGTKPENGIVLSHHTGNHNEENNGSYSNDTSVSCHSGIQNEEKYGSKPGDTSVSPPSSTYDVTNHPRLENEDDKLVNIVSHGADGGAIKSCDDNNSTPDADGSRSLENPDEHDEVLPTVHRITHNASEKLSKIGKEISPKRVLIGVKNRVSGTVRTRTKSVLQTIKDKKTQITSRQRHRSSEDVGVLVYHRDDAGDNYFIRENQEPQAESPVKSEEIMKTLDATELTKLTVETMNCLHELSVMSNRKELVEVLSEWVSCLHRTLLQYYTLFPSEHDDASTSFSAVPFIQADSQRGNQLSYGSQTPDAKEADTFTHAAKMNFDLESQHKELTTNKVYVPLKLYKINIFNLESKINAQVSELACFCSEMGVYGNIKELFLNHGKDMKNKSDFELFLTTYYHLLAPHMDRLWKNITRKRSTQDDCFISLLQCAKVATDTSSIASKLDEGYTEEAAGVLRSNIHAITPVEILAHLDRIYKASPKTFIELAAIDARFLFRPREIWTLMQTQVHPEKLSHLCQYLNSYINVQDYKERCDLLMEVLSDEHLTLTWFEGQLLEGPAEGHSTTLKCSCGMPRPRTHNIGWKHGDFMCEILSNRQSEGITAQLKELCYTHGYWSGYLQTCAAHSLDATFDKKHVFCVILQLGDLGLFDEYNNFQPCCLQEWEMLFGIFKSAHLNAVDGCLANCLKCNNQLDSTSPITDNHPLEPCQHLYEKTVFHSSVSDSHISNSQLATLLYTSNSQSDASIHTDALVHINNQSDAMLLSNSQSNSSSNTSQSDVLLHTETGQSEVLSQVIWENISLRMLHSIGTKQTAETLRKVGVPEGSISFDFYRKCLVTAYINIQQREIVHEMLEKTDAYLWSNRPTSLPPHILYQVNQDLECIPSTIASNSQLRQSKTDGSHGGSNSIKTLEDCGGHWGQKVDFEQPCGVCGLPLKCSASPVDAIFKIFHCEHAYHGSCVDLEVCPICD